MTSPGSEERGGSRLRYWFSALSYGVLAIGIGCGEGIERLPGPGAEASAAAPEATPATQTRPSSATGTPADRLPRVVAVGDLHADLPASLAALEMAGVIDGDGRWSGGEAVLVQTGDVTDRGPDSKEVIELLERLEGEAAAAGGRVIAMLGNHEAMNLMGDWRYVSPEDVEDFGTVEDRRAAFTPGAPIADRLLSSPMVVVLDRVVYTHGGVTPEYAEMGLDVLNGITPQVIAGRVPPQALGEDSPLWYRGYVDEPELTACKRLEAALLELAAERMVVGHTTRRDGRIQSRCGGRLLVIDTGISAHYGGHLSALEVLDGDARAIYPSGPEDLPDP